MKQKYFLTPRHQISTAYYLTTAMPYTRARSTDAILTSGRVNRPWYWGGSNLWEDGVQAKAQTNFHPKSVNATLTWRKNAVDDIHSC